MSGGIVDLAADCAICRLCCRDRYVACNNGELCRPLLTLTRQLKSKRPIMWRWLLSGIERRAAVGAGELRRDWRRLPLRSGGA